MTSASLGTGATVQGRPPGPPEPWPRAPRSCRRASPGFRRRDLGMGAGGRRAGATCRPRRGGDGPVTGGWRRGRWDRGPDRSPLRKPVAPGQATHCSSAGAQTSDTNQARVSSHVMAEVVDAVVGQAVVGPRRAGHRLVVGLSCVGRSLSTMSRFVGVSSLGSVRQNRPQATREQVSKTFSWGPPRLAAGDPASWWRRRRCRRGPSPEGWRPRAGCGAPLYRRYRPVGMLASGRSCEHEGTSSQT